MRTRDKKKALKSKVDLFRAMMRGYLSRMTELRHPVKVPIDAENETFLAVMAGQRFVLACIAAVIGPRAFKFVTKESTFEWMVKTVVEDAAAIGAESFGPYIRQRAEESLAKVDELFDPSRVLETLMTLNAEGPLALLGMVPSGKNAKMFKSFLKACKPDMEELMEQHP